MLRALLAAAAIFLLSGASCAGDVRPTRDERRAAERTIDDYIPGFSALPPEQQDEVRRQWRIEEARRCARAKDILGWGKALFPDKFPLPFCDELHGYFVQIRSDEFTNTEAPRGHAKTAIKCFLIPLFQALEEPKTFRHYLNIQATDDKALAVNRAIKLELENNRELLALYGPQVGERWTDAQFVLKSGVVFSAKSAGQSIRGFNYRNIRPDYLIVDDLYDEEDLNNPDSTKKKNDWFWGTLYKVMATGRRTSLHVQGTAINLGDLMAELQKDKSVKSRTFRAVTDWKAYTTLWPDLWTNMRGDGLTVPKKIEREKVRMGSLIFHREMQNERWDEVTAIIKRAWLEDWEYDPGELRLDLHQWVVAVLIGCDPSIGKEKENDYTGLATVYVTQRDDAEGVVFWIAELGNEHLTMVKRKERLQEMWEAQRRQPGLAVTEARIEANGAFKDFSAYVIANTNLPVKEVEQVKDKITVLQNKSHFFEHRKVRISNRIDPLLRAEMVHQLVTNYPQHDDIRDALLLCLDADDGIWKHVV